MFHYSHEGLPEHHRAPNSVDHRMDFDGLFSGDLGELSNMDTASQVNANEDDTTDQSQWQQQDDLNLDENTTTGGLSEETRTRLDEIQNELDRLHNEKADCDSKLAETKNPAVRVNIPLNILFKSISHVSLDCFTHQTQCNYCRNRSCSTRCKTPFNLLSSSLRLFI